MAAVEGHVKANTPEEENRLSDKEKDDLWEWMNAN